MFCSLAALSSDWDLSLTSAFVGRRSRTLLIWRDGAALEQKLLETLGQSSSQPLEVAKNPGSLQGLFSQLASKLGVFDLSAGDLSCTKGAFDCDHQRCRNTEPARWCPVQEGKVAAVTPGHRSVLGTDHMTAELIYH